MPSNQTTLLVDGALQLRSLLLKGIGRFESELDRRSANLECALEGPACGLKGTV